MDLYIANCTKFKFQFIYRRSEQPMKSITRMIAPGQQELICKDVGDAEIDYIINQHAAYGLKPAREIKNQSEFTGLCYSINRPVGVDNYMIAEEINDDALMRRSLEESKKEAAVGARKIAETGGQVSKIEIQEVTDTLSSSKKKKKINHTYNVESAH